MVNRNVRVGERFELSLGGVQIASIVVTALAALVLVFFLGVHTGERLGARRAEAARVAGLGELDRVTSAPAQKPVPPGELTYAAELPRAKPPGAPPPTPKQVKPAEPPPAPSPAAAPPAVEPKHAVADAARPPAAAAEPERPGGPSWTVQVGASQSRAEAEDLAKRLARLGARIEEADIPGKGHYYRVRLGRFPDRAAAEKYRADVARETGLKANLILPGG